MLDNFVPVFGLGVANVEGEGNEARDGPYLAPAFCAFPYPRWRPERTIQRSRPINTPAFTAGYLCSSFYCLLFLLFVLLFSRTVTPPQSIGHQKISFVFLQNSFTSVFIFQDVRHDVLYYYKPSPSSSSEPFVKFTNLPADRQLLLRNRDELEECRKIYQTMESA